MLLDWYVPHLTGAAATPGMRDEFDAIWSEIIGRLAHAEQGWVLLDYHSPNLIWRGEREGLARVGMIDFQDLMTGPSAYDVASLCQDARVTVPPDLEAELRGRYVERRRKAAPDFDVAAFGEAYAKSQAGSGVVLPRRGKALVSVRERDKPGAVEMARKLLDRGKDIGVGDRVARQQECAPAGVLELGAQTGPGFEVSQ